MLRVPTFLGLMKWHQDNRSHNGLHRHAGDSKAWAHIDSTWPQFVVDPHNVQLGLALDGVNPFGNQLTTWSTWLIIIFNYNLPPWLTTTKFFLVVVLLIPGK
jgi:hypothetical protein